MSPHEQALVVRLAFLGGLVGVYLYMMTFDVFLPALKARQRRRKNAIRAAAFAARRKVFEDAHPHAMWDARRALYMDMQHQVLITDEELFRGLPLCD